MKTKLTREESEHLISLGVPKEKASGKYFVPQGKPIVSSVGVLNEIAKSYPIFKLEDFLNGEILPKEIVVKGEIAELCFDWNSQIKRWCAAYSWLSEEYESHEEELIDALYSLTCWYYGEFLKREKK